MSHSRVGTRIYRSRGDPFHRSWGRGSRCCGGTAELPDLVGDFDGEAIVQVAGHDEHGLADLFPGIDQDFPFIEKRCPASSLLAAASNPPAPVARIIKGTEEMMKENRPCWSSSNPATIPAGQSRAWKVPFCHDPRYRACLSSPRIEEVKVTIAHGEFPVTTPANGIGHGVRGFGRHVSRSVCWSTTSLMS